MENSRFLEKMTTFFGRFNNQVHLRALRDAFSALMPAFLLVSVWLLLSVDIFPLFGFKLDRSLAEGLLGFSDFLTAALTAYFLIQNRKYKQPISLALAAVISFTLCNGFKFTNSAGPESLLAAFLIACAAVELCHWLSGLRFLQVRLGKEAPHSIEETLTEWLAFGLTVSVFACFSAFTTFLFHKNLVAVINWGLQAPLQFITTSLWGYLLIYSLGNFMFAVGIHQTAVNGTLLEPFLLISMLENMETRLSGTGSYHILNTDFQTVYAQIGGTGLTFALLLTLAVFFRKKRAYQEILKMGWKSSIFEINEPLIFGLPIAYNLPLMIPFVLSPVIGILIGYAATAFGFVHPLTVFVPWFTPVFLSGFLASGGDFKVVLLQAIIIALCALFYLPFLKIAAGKDLT